MMEKKETVGGKGIVGGFVWSFGERILAQLVSLVVGVVLARVLAPEDYGVVAIVMVFISICNIFVTSGFGTAIVRQEKAESVDFNTAFFLSFGISLALYVVIFFAAPYVARFYEIDVLTPVMRVFGIRLIITSINNIQQAYIQRQMKFKKFFVATLFGTVLSCVVGIAMAYNGFGVWALVAQYMTNTTIDTIVLLIVGGWRVKFEFSKKSAINIYSFGWKLLCSQLVYTLSNNARNLIIGKVFGASDLAYYEQGNKYPAVIVDNVNVAISKVMLPTFARVQNEQEKFKQLLRNSIRMGMFVIAPIMFGFAAVSESFVNVFLTEKWLPAVPFIQIACMSHLTRPLEELCHRAILALGKSGTIVRVMITINVVSLLLTMIAAFLLKSVLWVALCTLAHTLTSLLCFSFVSKKYVGYTVKEQLNDVLPVSIISLTMGGLVYLMCFIDVNEIVLLISQILVGGIIYVLLSGVFKIEQFRVLKKKIFSKAFRKK